MSPDTVRGYRELSQAGEKANVLGAKTRELMALAVAVTRQCDGCIAVHTDAALRNGATREEIDEALSVAIAVNAGATLVYSSRVMDAISVQGSVQQFAAADGPSGPPLSSHVSLQHHEDRQCQNRPCSYTPHGETINAD